MKTEADRRSARTPVQEGLSLIPYFVIYQRLHRRRWAMALGGLALGLAAGWLWSRRSARQD